MATLRFLTQTPPGGFVYRQAETGLTVTGDSLHDLASKVRAHRRYKGLKPDDESAVALDVHRQICTRLGKDECQPEENDNWVPVPITRRFTLMDMLAFSSTMLEWIKNGGRLVHIDEAKGRKGVCAVCPLNQKQVGCKCGVFYKAINAVIPKERRWDDLHVCAICACSLNTKVNVPMSVLATDKRPLSYPVHCWLHPDNHKVLPPTP